MALAAKSMGYTNERMGEFIKLVSEGKVQSREFILKFSDELRNNVRETGALKAALETVNTARMRFFTSFQTGVGEGFSEAQSGIVEFFETLAIMMKENIGSFKSLGRIISGIFHGLVVGLNILRPFLYYFSTLLNQITETFDNAFSSDVAIENLTAIERGMKIIAGWTQMIVGGWMMILSLIMDVADSLNVAMPKPGQIPTGSPPAWLERFGVDTGKKSVASLIKEKSQSKDWMEGRARRDLFFKTPINSGSKTVQINNPQLNIQNPVNGNIKEAVDSAGDSLWDNFIGVW